MRLIFKYIFLYAAVTFTSLTAAAQTDINKLTLDRGGTSGLIIRNDRSDIIRDTRTGVMEIDPGYDKEYDDRLKELDEQIEERKWSDESSAWARACEIDTRNSYQKYIDRYPDGVHRGEADNKIVDFDVEEIFKGEFSDLPIMELVEEDRDKPVSLIEVQNNTKYELTVMYKGTQNKMIKIPAGSHASVTVENGYYQVAAYVPPKWIKPYAGRQEFVGGRYKTGFWVVYGY